MTEQKKLQDLLKLKNSESPGEQYFDAFLSEFHRYQRTELLQETSRWKLWMESIQELLTVAPRPVYAFSSSMALCVCVLVLVFWSRIGGSQSAEHAAFADADQSVAPSLYADPAWQQPELHHAATTRLDEDFGTPRYVTGQVLVTYDSALAF